ncbi:hypothetical protein MPTK1_3g23820 [Marchantia polymorpha subsp. ruderalis]|uniref:dihydroneopterin aldolase n=2 Tax=Marchantia polymorpha TaxID=3197 RepID=A0AAF6B444_MARPO|nr:hypothetical protein MARPO_0121s0041 [Marchantia polymorpha]BBN06778.1 hypothetical protein Mp_3g23820 [Marchantia polymorpha subsp. ruderalis]|eukprot:PTQ30698.1 hypothetical protein MARPO_0121s0041 [Marchantia polymorpha]
MAQRLSAAVIRAVRNCSEYHLRRCRAAPNGGALQCWEDAQGHPRVFNHAVAAFRRSSSSYEGSGEPYIPERVKGKDRLIIRGGKFQGYHGVIDEEKILGQKFMVDVDAWVDLKKCGTSDDVNDTVSYADVFRCAPSVSLLNLTEPRRFDFEEKKSELVNQTESCSFLPLFPH